MKTMDVDNALLADDAKDRKKLYRDLQKQIEKTEKRRAKITTAAGAMASEAETLFKNWETSAAAIESESLRTRSQKRLKQTKAAQLYEPVMKALADQVKYLGPRLDGKRLVRTPWAGEFRDYAVVGGVRIPTRAEVRWELLEGPFTTWRGRITSLELVPSG